MDKSRTHGAGRGAAEKMRRARRRRRVLIFKMILIASLTLLAILGLIDFLLDVVKPKVTLEAGSALPAVSDFLKRKNVDAKVVSGLDDSVDMHAVGDYQVVIRVGKREYTSVLQVVDTVKPVVAVRNQRVYVGEQAEPDDFIDSIADMTETTAVFAEPPDFSTEGSRKVRLWITDQGGNRTVAEANAEVIRDTEAPVISGVEELTIAAGETVSYKRNVTVADDCDDDVALTVDNSAVNLTQEGDYPVTYIAVDEAGNETREETVLHVTTPAAETATEEYINGVADKLLAEITTEDMSLYEKAKKIYYWVHDSIAYYDGTPKTNWIQGAFHGLVERRGDCFVYAMTSKVLLTRAGIANMDIEKIPTSRRHYWNLIDIGEGWHHFDATRRKDGHTFFYLTDEELMTYSRAHYGSHNYDPSLYPEIQ